MVFVPLIRVTQKGFQKELNFILNFIRLQNLDVNYVYIKSTKGYSKIIGNSFLGTRIKKYSGAKTLYQNRLVFSTI